MMFRRCLVLLLLPGCSTAPQSDLQYIKQARSAAAEWALVNDQASEGRLTATYVRSMHRWIHDDVQTAARSLTRPDSPYGNEIRAILAEPPDAPPEVLRSHAQALKQIETRLESA